MFQSHPSLCDVPHEASSAPNEGIVALIPIHETLSACNARYSCPAATKTDVVFVVEKVGRISWIEFHCFEAMMRGEGGAGPFPEPADITLTSEATPFGSDWGGVPMLEADVSALQVDEEV